MRAMVLAAGRGERLRPLTETLPKPMIPVAGKPLIFYTLTYLKNCGVEEVVVNLHHLGDMIQEYVGDGRQWGLRVFYSKERKLLGTGGGIQKAASHLFGEAFVVVNADILVGGLDLRDVLRFHRENHAAVTMVLRRDPEVDRYGVIETDGYGLVRQVLGKLAAPSGPWNRLMFTGIHVLEPDVFSYMQNRQNAFSIIDVYLDMLRAGERIMGYEMKGFWTDLGTRTRYEDLQRMLEQGKISIESLVQGCDPIPG